MDYTKGPWKFEDRPGTGQLILAKTPDDESIRNHVEFHYKAGVYVPIYTSVWVQFTSKSYKEMQVANGKLMAAAPDMYEALKAIIESGEIPLCYSDNLVIAAKVALAKAEGKTPDPGFSESEAKQMPNAILRMTKEIQELREVKTKLLHSINYAAECLDQGYEEQALETLANALHFYGDESEAK